MATWQDFAASYGDTGPIGKLSGVHNSKLFDTMANQIAKAIGYTGKTWVPGTYEFENANEGGTFMDKAQGKTASPEFLKALEAYQFSRDADKLKGTITDTAGQSVGNFTAGNKDTGFDKFAEVAVPLGLAAIGGGAAGLFGPVGGGAAAGSGAAAAGAADIGTLGLAEGVYGAGGALGAGAVPGTVGGLSGSTAAFGGLGSVLPSGVGFAAPGALAGAAFDLSTVGGVDPAGMVPSTPQPVEFGGQGLLGEPTFTPSLSGGIEPFVAELPAIGAEATAFGGLPELSALAAGAPAQTAFGSFGAGLLAPEAAPAFTFDPGALPNANPLGGGLAPTVETLPTIGAETTAFGNLPELSALANGAAATTPLGSFALPSQPAGGGLSGLLGKAADVVNPGLQWLKDNPTLGRLLLGGATGLLSGGGSSGGSSTVNTGPAKQWSSPLQQGLLTPVQQYAPAAIQQRPAGLLAQGYANDGAWRYLKG